MLQSYSVTLTMMISMILTQSMLRIAKPMMPYARSPASSGQICLQTEPASRVKAGPQIVAERGHRTA